MKTHLQAMPHSEFWVEYQTWVRMLRRCYNPHHSTFKHYGGRGVTVCSRWRHNFIAFLNDMGPRPSATHSIDRISNDGDYSPANCRWATKAEQMANRRNARIVTIDGVTGMMKHVATEIGLNYKLLHKHVAYWGRTPQQAADFMRRHHG